MIKCLICNQEFEKRVSFCNHIVRKHKLNSKEYYDKYLKRPEDGVCKYDSCNKPTHFLNVEEGYKECCCLEHTNLYRYGVKSNLNFAEVKEKAQKNSHTPEAIEKQAQTNLKRYGTKAPIQNAEIKHKIKQTCLDKYGVENPYQAEEVKAKCAKTKEERYGDANYNNRDKAKQTCLEKYGVSSVMKIDEVKAKTQTKSARKKKALSSRKTVLKKNNISTYEKLFMNLANEIELNYEYQYYSDEYPYLCDFYIPKLNCYIEIHGHWTHGGHWFDENNQEDINKLHIWESKSINSTMYKSAIYTWTKLDVDKRNIAKKNNLNYIVLWSISDIKTWFSLNFTNQPNKQ